MASVAMCTNQTIIISILDFLHALLKLPNVCYKTELYPCIEKIIASVMCMYWTVWCRGSVVERSTPNPGFFCALFLYSVLSP